MRWQQHAEKLVDRYVADTFAQSALDSVARELFLVSSGQLSLPSSSFVSSTHVREVHAKIVVFDCGKFGKDYDTETMLAKEGSDVAIEQQLDELCGFVGTELVKCEEDYRTEVVRKAAHFNSSNESFALSMMLQSVSETYVLRKLRLGALFYSEFVNIRPFNHGNESLAGLFMNVILRGATPVPART